MQPFLENKCRDAENRPDNLEIFDFLDYRGSAILYFRFAKTKSGNSSSHSSICRSSENRTHITHSRSVYTTIVRYSEINYLCTRPPREQVCSLARRAGYIPKSERETRIGLASQPWEGCILPLYYSRKKQWT